MHCLVKVASRGKRIKHHEFAIVTTGFRSHDQSKEHMTLVHSGIFRRRSNPGKCLSRVQQVHRLRFALWQSSESHAACSLIRVARPCKRVSTPLFLFGRRCRVNFVQHGWDCGVGMKDIGTRCAQYKSEFGLACSHGQGRKNPRYVCRRLFFTRRGIVR